MTIKHLYTILFCTTLVACTSEDLTDAKLSNELLNVEKEVEMSAVETERDVTVSADCHWEVAVERTGWGDLTVSPMSGDGNGKITIKTGTNPSVSERTAILTITSAEGLKQKITVRQTVGGATLSVNQTELSFEAIPTASQLFTVTSNTTWEILGFDTDWLTVEPSSGSGTTQVKVTAAENQDDSDRELTLTVALTAGTETCDIRVVQSGKTNISLALTPETLNEFEATGGEQTVSVSCNAQWFVDMPNQPDWLTLNASGNEGDGQVTARCLPNYTTSSRSIRVFITAGSRNPKQVSFAVNQKAGTMPEITAPLSIVDNSLSISGASLTFGYTSMFPLTDYGICYSTSNTVPTIADQHISFGAGTTADNAVVAAITGLSSYTTCYVRAYAISPMEGGTPTYSNVMSFTTLGEAPNIDDNLYPELAPKR